MATNITYHPTPLTPTTRSELRNHQGGLTIWLTGLSGSGKSTIAVALEQALLRDPYGVHAYRLDGDNVRLGLNRDLGFSASDRAENIRRIAEVARLFADSCAVAITSFISPYRADREAARGLHGRMEGGEGGGGGSGGGGGGGDGYPFVEVWVDVSLAEAERRDPKGLYKKAREGKIADFTGVSAPYEEPLDPEVHIKGEETSVEDAVKQIVAYLNEKAYLRPQLPV